jgi:hypothetical protein
MAALGHAVVVHVLEGPLERRPGFSLGGLADAGGSIHLALLHLGRVARGEAQSLLTRRAGAARKQQYQDHRKETDHAGLIHCRPPLRYWPDPDLA